MPEPEPPPPPAAPAAPNYAQATREGIETEVEMLPLRYETQLEYGPKFMEQDTTSRIAAQRKFAEAGLQLEGELGSQYVDQRMALAKRADPIGSAIRDELGERLREELEMGSDLDEQTKHQIVQAYRAGASLRGGGGGDEHAVGEALEIGMAGERRKQGRIANAMSYVGLRPPSADYGALEAAGNTVTPFNPLAYGENPVINPAAGGMAAQFAQSVYGDQLRYNTSVYGAELDYRANAANPWLEGLGIAVGAASTGAGLAMAGA